MVEDDKGRRASEKVQQESKPLSWEHRMWNNTVATLMIAKPQRQCLNIAIDKVGEQEPRPWHKTRGKEQAEEEAIGADSEVEVRVAGGEKKKLI